MSEMQEIIPKEKTYVVHFRFVDPVTDELYNEAKHLMVDAIKDTILPRPIFKQDVSDPMQFLCETERWKNEWDDLVVEPVFTIYPKDEGIIFEAKTTIITIDDDHEFAC